MHSLRTALALVATALVLQACDGSSDTDLLASANAYLEKKDTAAAIIELKSALQKNPQSAEARLLLGRSLLDSGDAAGALVELRRAQELSMPAVRVVPPLARAELLTGQARRVVDSHGQTTLGDAAADADLQTTLALAHLREDQPDRGQAALARALELQPAYTPALLLQARLAAAAKDYAKALAVLDGITQRDPAQGEAWLLKGEIQQHGSGDAQAALVSYRAAVAARGELVAAHQGIVGLLVQAGDMPGAKAHVDQLAKAQPNAPAVKLMEAQLAYLAKDFETARALLQPLLRLAPNNPALLQLAGATEFRLRNLTLAETLLANAVRQAPHLALARKLLTQTYLRMGQPDKALETLAPELAGNAPGGETLMLAGQAHLQSGDAKKAEDFFTRAARARPEDPRARTAVALGKIGAGQSEAGLAELAVVSASDRGITADLALVAAHIRRNDLRSALQAIDALERKQPDQPLAPNLRGRLQAVAGDAAAARASFERALALDPSYFPAIVSLASLDLSEKKPDAARKRFEDLIKAEPKNHRAMLALAKLLARTGGKPSEIGAQLTAAVAAAPNEATPRLLLVNHLLATGQRSAALTSAQQAVTAHPTHRDLASALGRAQLANRQFQQAVTTFNGLQGMQPNSVAAQLGLADAQLGLKDVTAAERALQRALEIDPRQLQAQRGLIGILAGEGRYPDALAIARRVQTQRNREAVGHVLEGDIELHRGQHDAALAAYRAGLAKERRFDVAVALHRATLAAGRSDEAERFAATWQREQPQDVAFRYYLGDLAIARNDWAGAETRYREVLRVSPDHALALNNVAWLMVKQSRPGALALAERANSLLPEQPALLDTLALALAAENQVERALALQRKTLEMAPEDPTLRLTLARLYLQAGNKAHARAELEDLRKLGTGFRDHAEVTALLKQV